MITDKQETKMLLTIPKVLNDGIVEDAKKERRTRQQHITYILEQYLKQDRPEQAEANAA